jgi:hypothetical protein
MLKTSTDLRRWFRYVNQRLGEISVCEDELGSAEDLKDCQEDSPEIPNCQEGKELRLLRDLTDCHEDSQGISHCQEGNDMRSLRDLMDCQEGSRKIPICQVGMGTEMRLFESLMNSEVSLNQPEELTEQVSSENGFGSARAADREGRSEKSSNDWGN